MARSKPGSPVVLRPAKFKPHNDPTAITAARKIEAERFRAMMRRTREATGHNDEARKLGRCRCGYCGKPRIGGEHG